MIDPIDSMMTFVGRYTRADKVRPMVRCGLWRRSDRVTTAEVTVGAIALPPPK